MNVPAALKPFVAIAAFLAVVTAVVAGQKYGVTVTAEKGVDFAKFKTYTWTPGGPSPDPAVDGYIKAAVDRELGVLGLTKAASGTGDVLVTYFAVRRTDVDLEAKPDAGGFLQEQAAGTLVVGLLDPTSRRQLLRLRTDKAIDTAFATREATINDAVTELFAQYPTRAKK
jgi:hypothetical protein